MKHAQTAGHARDGSITHQETPRARGASSDSARSTAAAERRSPSASLSSTRHSILPPLGRQLAPSLSVTSAYASCAPCACASSQSVASQAASDSATHGSERASTHTPRPTCTMVAAPPPPPSLASKAYAAHPSTARPTESASCGSSSWSGSAFEPIFSTWSRMPKSR